MSARTVAVLLFAASVVGGGGCSSDSGVGPTAGPAGVYSIPEVQGTVWPVQVARGAVFIPDDNRHRNDFIAAIIGGRMEVDATGDDRNTIGYLLKQHESTLRK
jgi:hypothetical protein